MFISHIIVCFLLYTLLKAQQNTPIYVLWESKNFLSTKFQKYSFKTDCYFKREGGTRIELQLAAALLCKQVFYK